jgi:cholinesterase
MLVGNNAHEINLFTLILGIPTTKSMGSIAGGAFGCPSADAAKARSAKNVKSWRYLYSGEWPNQMIAPEAGAWHGSEIGMVFGSTEYQQQFYSKMTKQSISFPDTEEQKKLAKTMMTAWTSFAKDPEHGLEKLGWPVYDPASRFHQP